MNKLLVILVVLVVLVACGGESTNAMINESAKVYSNLALAKEVKTLTESTRIEVVSRQGELCSVKYDGGQGWLQCNSVSFDSGVEVPDMQELVTPRPTPVPDETQRWPSRHTPQPSSGGSGGSSGGGSSVYRVEYRVTGQGARRGGLTYNNETGNTEQRTVKIPWSQKYSMPYGEFAYISVQNEGKAGNVTCEILINGQVTESATSRGAYAIATCSGRVE